MRAMINSAICPVMLEANHEELLPAAIGKKTLVKPQANTGQLAQFAALLHMQGLLCWLGGG